MTLFRKRLKKLEEDDSFPLWIAVENKSDGLIRVIAGKSVFVTLDGAVLHAHANNLKVSKITVKRTALPEDINYEHVEGNRFRFDGHTKELKEEI